MPFQSLEQAYFLYNYKRVAFNRIAGAGGVPFLWHEYKDLRDKGTPAKDAEKMIHDPRIKKWQMVLKRKNPTPEDIVWINNDELDITQLKEKLDTLKAGIGRPANRRYAIQEAENELARRKQIELNNRQKEIDRALAYRKKQLAQKRNIKREREQSERKDIVDRRSKRTIIDNYFEMYRNQGKGQPTLEDIKREEGRPLTAEEESSYYKKIKGEQ